MRVLVVSKHPEHYAATWRKLATRGVDLAFAPSQARAQREIEKAEPDAIIVVSGSMESRPGRMISTLRRRAFRSSMILINDGSPGAPEHRMIDMHLRPPLEWQALLSLLQRPRKVKDAIVSGPFRLSLSCRTLAGPFGEKRLTPVMCDLMAYFMSHPGVVLTRPVLMQKVWKTTYLGDTRTLDVHVSWLRRIVEEDPASPQHILTRRGEGYLFVPGE